MNRDGGSGRAGRRLRALLLVNLGLAAWLVAGLPSGGAPRIGGWGAGLFPDYARVAIQIEYRYE